MFSNFILFAGLISSTSVEGLFPPDSVISPDMVCFGLSSCLPKVSLKQLFQGFNGKGTQKRSENGNVGDDHLVSALFFFFCAYSIMT